MHWRAAVLDRELGRWPGAVEYAARLATGGEVRALAYPEVVGELEVGDPVLLNVSALVKGLGTGGAALVVVAPDRLPADPDDGRGHIVKARYTPQQQLVLAVDEPDSPYAARLAGADSLAGVPVVVADLHSALPAVVAGVRADRPETRVAYVMTDGGALPLALSRTVAGLVEAGWLATTVTAGQAFGGALEAVSVHGALLAARHVGGADLVVVAQGPGNAGTGTRWGFSGLGAVEALHAAAVLGGSPVAGLRISAADPRERHRGISHHSLTAYGRALLAPADLPVPRLRDPELGPLVRRQADRLVREARAALRLCEVDPTGLEAALRDCPVPLSTMGRGPAADPAAFLASAAAGRHAAGLLG